MYLTEIEFLPSKQKKSNAIKFVSELYICTSVLWCHSFHNGKFLRPLRYNSDSQFSFSQNNLYAILKKSISLLLHHLRLSKRSRSFILPELLKSSFSNWAQICNISVSTIVPISLSLCNTNSDLLNREKLSSIRLKCKYYIFN